MALTGKIELRRAKCRMGMLAARKERENVSETGIGRLRNMAKDETNWLKTRSR